MEKEFADVVKKGKLIGMDELVDAYIKQNYSNDIVVAYYVYDVEEDLLNSIIEELKKQGKGNLATALLFEVEVVITTHNTEEDAYKEMMKFENKIYASLYVNGRWTDENT